MSEQPDLDLDTVDSALDEPWHLLEDAANNRATTRRQLAKLLEQLGVSDRRVREDYEGRFAIELLQNAHDACHDDGTVGQAWFVLTRTALLVGNQGHAFDGPRIAALTRLGASTKGTTEPERHVIGYKGIGFSSVFSITDRPQISSDGVRFGFDRAAANELVAKHLGRTVKQLAVRCLPFRLDACDFEDDADEVERLHSEGAVTVIRLPLRHSPEDVRTVLGTSLTGEALLFMPHLDGLTVRDGQTTRWWKRSSGKVIGSGTLVHLDHELGRTSWLTASTTVAAPARTSELEDEIWKTVTSLNASVALPWKTGGVDATREDQRVHVYFPTDDRLGRSVLVHGDFFLHSSRRYIQDTGAGGAISEAVAEGVAELTAELSASVAADSPGLLDALAYQAPASGFGTTINRFIDERLRETPIVRSHTRNEVRRATELSVLDTSLEPDVHRRLFESLRDPHTLVAFDLDQGRSAEFLRDLGVDRLTPFEVVERISMAKVGGSYENALGVLKAWYDSLSTSQRNNVRPRLRWIPAVKDDQGRWRPGHEVRRYVGDLPAPPLRLRPPALRAPSGYDLNVFINNVLGVEPLTPESLFNDVLQNVADVEGTPTVSESRKTLRFLLQLWRNHRAAFDHDDSRRHRVRVPVRAAKGRKPMRSPWVFAGEAYFDSELTGNPWVEQLYGRFDRPEFVDVAASGCQGDDAAPFLAALGVSAAPRLLNFEFDATSVPSSLHARLVAEWLASDEVAAAHCSSHPHRSAEVTFEMVDRLDSMLGNPRAEHSGVLASMLARLEDPFGPHATIACSAPRCYHRRPVSGYQRWLLTTRAWIPCRDEGRLVLRQPNRSWYGIPRTVPHVLPRVDLPDDVAEPLGCVSFNRPTVDAIETAFRSLARKHPDLDVAGDQVTSTVDVLMDRLELAAEKSDGSGTRVSLPSRRDGRRLWSTRPVVADVPHVDRLPGIALLIEGAWPSVQKAYDLQRASEIVKHEIQLSGEGLEPVLDDQMRVELVALLTRKSDRGQIARLIGRLAEEPVGEVRLELSHGADRARTDPLPFHLADGRDGDTERTRHGTLYTTPSTSGYLYPLAGALAAYLGTPHRDLIHSYFTAPHHVLENERIDASRIAEAADALATFPFDVPEPRNVVRDLADLVAVPEGPPGSSPEPPYSPVHPERSDEGPDVSARPRDEPEHHDHAPLDDDADFSEPWPQSPSGEGGPAAASPNPNGVPGGPPQASNGQWGRAATPSPGAGRPLLDWNEDEASRASFQSVAPRPAPFGVSGVEPRRETSGTVASVEPPVSRAEVEERAVRLAARYGEGLGASVARVDARRLGWDLEFDFGHERWLVEVKGMAGETKGLVVTRNELTAARTRPGYRFIVVSGVGYDRGLLTVLNPTASELDPDSLEALSWRVRPWRAWTIATEELWTLNDENDPFDLPGSDAGPSPEL